MNEELNTKKIIDKNTTPDKYVNILFIVLAILFKSTTNLFRKDCFATYFYFNGKEKEFIFKNDYSGCVE